jgi:hypothetical protein
MIVRVSKITNIDIDVDPGVISSFLKMVSDEPDTRDKPSDDAENARYFGY